MKITVLPAHQLDASLQATWRDIQRSDDRWDSPYFHPEFTRAVAEVRPNIEVAILESDGQVAGFFPFERHRRTARPVGLRLSDYQAVICRPGLRIDPAQLLRRSGLAAFEFDHLLVSQSEFVPYHELTDHSPVLDLAKGFAPYRQARTALGDEGLRDAERKRRKVLREIGPLQLVPASKDMELLRTLMAWKSDQYRRTSITDVFSYGWTQALVENLLGRQTSEFSGMLSALMLDGRPIALHMGMMCRGVLHYWFPTYDTKLSRYSPGCLLLMELVRSCQEIGISKIDMGRGVTRFKSRMMTGTTLVAAGKVDLRPAASWTRRRLRCAEDWVRQSRLRPAARVPGRVLYRVRQWLAFR